MSYKKVLDFLHDVVVSPTELEKNRMEYHKKREFKKIHLERAIMNVVISCKTEDHIDSCRGWVEYMFKRRILDLYMLEGLHKAIDLKREEVLRIGSREVVLPYLLKRSEQIAKDEVKRLHIVKDVNAINA